MYSVFDKKVLINFILKLIDYWASLRKTHVEPQNLSLLIF